MFVGLRSADSPDEERDTEGDWVSTPAFSLASFTVSGLPVWAATTVDKVKALKELDGPIKALMKCSEQYGIQSMLKCLRENKGPFLAKTQMFEEFGQCGCLISCANKRGAATKGSRVSNQPTQAVSLEEPLSAGRSRDRSKGCLLYLGSLYWQSRAWTC